ncbi:hypothetical protein [Caulobacter sp.]|uniref:hypothetical protein n=1 Tax=Caulobacter sp. TaxID=78 RepID=UPI003BAEF59A
MHLQFAPILGWSATFLVCALAWAKGSAPERLGSLIVIAGSIAAALIQILLSARPEAVAMLLLEGVYSLAFLMLALRYTRVWLGVAMLLQAMQFGLHAYYIVAERRHDLTYGLVNNLNSIGVLLCILFGIFVSARRRARAAK